MITNKGKNIIAKYLIGDAPGYASYIALGCGPKPRPNINQKDDVSLAQIQGIVTSGTNSVITEISSTLGLVPGMTLTRISGIPLGENATIVSVDSLTKITINTTTPTGTPTTVDGIVEYSGGTVTFSTSGVASLLSLPASEIESVDATDGLWIGARVSNEFIQSEELVIVTAINRKDDTFVVAPGLGDIAFPTSLIIQTDPRKEVLDFEMFRVPVSSRGYANDNGVNKIILTAQLPTEERYEITEVGIYSAGSNSIAGRYDSKVITAFSANENWELVTKQEAIADEIPIISVQAIPQYLDNDISSDNEINKTDPAIKTNTSNNFFLGEGRLEKYERPRFLSNVIMLKSDSSQIFKNVSNSLLDIKGLNNYIQISGKSIDLSKNSTSDLLKVAFSIISINGNDPDVPDFANVIVEFSNSANTQIARLEINADNNILDFDQNRYVVSQKRIDELTYSGDSLSWRDVSVIKVYASTNDRLAVTSKQANGTKATITTGTTEHNVEVGEYVLISIGDTIFDGYKKVTEKTNTTISFVSSSTVAATAVTSGFVDVVNKNFYISLDGIRLDNVTTANPLYGLTGYSLVQNIESSPIVKAPNSSNYIEYRFVLDVI
jgi:hypothetical protein